MKVIILFAVLNIITFAASTKVQKCQGSPARSLDEGAVDVSNCDKSPCILKKKSTVHINMKFVPERDVTELTTAVTAQVVGLELPFVGVDGTPACGHLFEEDGETQADCKKLESGKTYVYKNSFKVLDIYPKLQTVVTWALTDRNGKHVTCFKIPAKITS